MFRTNIAAIKKAFAEDCSGIRRAVDKKVADSKKSEVWKYVPTEIKKEINTLGKQEEKQEKKSVLKSASEAITERVDSVKEAATLAALGVTLKAHSVKESVSEAKDAVAEGVTNAAHKVVDTGAGAVGVVMDGTKKAAGAVAAGGKVVADTAVDAAHVVSGATVGAAVTVGAAGVSALSKVKNFGLGLFRKPTIEVKEKVTEVDAPTTPEPVVDVEEVKAAPEPTENLPEQAEQPVAENVNPIVIDNSDPIVKTEKPLTMENPLDYPTPYKKATGKRGRKPKVSK